MPSVFRSETLVVGQDCSACVSHTAGPYELYVQILDNEGKLSELTESLYSFTPSSLPRVTSATPLGTPLLAVFSEDESNYRAVVKQPMDGERCVVHFVDYGNEEVSSFSSLGVLPAELCDLPMQAIRCALDPARVGPGCGTELLNMELANVMVKRMQPDAGAVCLVDIIMEGDKSLTDLLAAKYPSNKGYPPFDASTMSPGSVLDVCVAHQDAIHSTILLQNLARSATLEALESLGEASVAPLIGDVCPGVLCLVRVDGRFFRAQVVAGIDEQGQNEAQFYLVDGGDTVSVGSADRFELTPALAQAPCQVFTCHWPGNVLKTPCKAAVEIMGLSEEGCVNVRVIKTDGSAGYVPPAELELLVSLRPKIRQGLKISCGATLYDSKDRLFLQSTSVFNKVIKYQEKLLEFYTNHPSVPSLPAPTVGDYCCVVYPEDDGWYRARVVSTNSGLAEVLLIDFGNVMKAEFNALKMLTPGFHQEVELGFECRFLETVIVSDDVMREAVLGMEKILVKVEDVSQKVAVVSLVADPINDPLKAMLAPRSVAVPALNGIDHGRSIPAPIRKTPGYKPNTLPAQSFDATVSFMNNPSDFFVNVTSSADDLAVVNIKLAEAMAAVCEPINHAVLGMPCCSLFMEEWYRAKVTEVLYTEVLYTEVKIQFVDYGNEEILSRSDVYYLPADLNQLPEQALRCCVGSVPLTNWTDDQTARFEQLAGEGVTISVLSQQEGITHVKVVSADGVSLTEEFSGSAQTMAAVGGSAAGSRLNIPAASISKDRFTTVIGFYESPSKFWVQEEASAATVLLEIENLLNADPGLTSVSLSETYPGQPCVAVYDGTLCRGVVLEDAGETVKVHYVDYGNVESVNKTLAYPLTSPGILSIPAQAYECCLKDSTLRHRQWTQDEIGMFAEAIYQQDNFDVIVLFREGTVLYVDGKDGSLVDTFLGEPSAKNSLQETAQTLKYAPLTLPARTFGATMSFITNPSEFFVNVTSSADDLAVVNIKLAETMAAGCEPVTSTVLGMPCCSLFMEEWYRAKVLEDLGSEVKIQFVDYGNEETVAKTDVYPLPANLAQLPEQALQCCLGSVPLTNWTEDQILSFQQLTEEEVEVSVVAVVEGKNVYHVTLSAADGSSIDEALISASTPSGDLAAPFKYIAPPTPAQTFGATMSFMKNPSDFFVNVTSSADDLAVVNIKLAETMAAGCEPVTSTVLGMPCCSLFMEEWYRAKVMEDLGSQVKIQFVDYGNEETVAKTDVYLLPANLAQLPEQALQCCLGSMPLTNWTEDQTAQFECEAAAEMNLSVLSKEGNVLHVDRFSADGGSLAELLLGRSQPESTDQTAPAAAVHVEAAASHPHAQQPASPSPAAAATRRAPSPAPSVVPTRRAPSPAPSVASSTGMSSAADTPIPVEVVWVLHPGAFWLQKSSAGREIEAIMDAVTAEAAKAATLPEPTIGALCLTQFTEDGGWYRARILDEEDGMVNVQFIDYGNTDTVNVNELKIASQVLQDAKPYAVECKLRGLHPPRGALWDEDSQHIMEEMVKSGGVTARMLSTRRPPLVVDLILSDGRSVANELVAANVARHLKSRPAPATGPRPTQALSTGVSAADVIATVASPQVVSPAMVSPAVVSPAAGMKFDLLIPDGSTTNVHVYVSHTVSPTEFWVQKASSEEALGSIGELLATATPASLTNPATGDFCIATFSEDGSPYRAVITSLAEGNASVLFIDYGNSDVLPAASLGVLPDGVLSTTPPLAFLCALHFGSADHSSQEVHDHFCVLTSEASLTASVMNTADLRSGMIPVHTVELTDDQGKSIFRELTESRAGGGDAVNQANKPTTPSSAVLSYKPDELENGQQFLTYLSCINSPDDIWVQKESGTAGLRALMDRIKTWVSSGSAASLGSAAAAGAACLVQFSEDKMWYRGEIISVDGDQATVLFVDYGSVEVVTTSTLLLPSAEIMSDKLYLFRARLSKGTNEVWVEDAYDKLVELTSDKATMCTVLERGQDGTGSCWDRYVVMLKDGDSDLARSLVLTVPDSAVLDSGVEQAAGGNAQEDTQEQVCFRVGELASEVCNVWVAFITVEGVLCCQTESSSEALELLMVRIQEYAVSENARQLSAANMIPSTPCLAWFSGDEKWYRGEIVSVDGEQATVRFVDYGNTDSVSLQYLLAPTAEIMHDPVYAHSCTLCDIPSVTEGGKFSGEAISKMSDLTFDQLCECTVVSRTENDPATGRPLYVVKTVIDGKDIGQQLITEGLVQTSTADNITEVLPTEADPSEVSELSRAEEITADTDSLPVPVEDVTVDVTENNTAVDVTENNTTVNATENNTAVDTTENNTAVDTTENNTADQSISESFNVEVEAKALFEQAEVTMSASGNGGDRADVPRISHVVDLLQGAVDRVIKESLMEAEGTGDGAESDSVAQTADDAVRAVARMAINVCCEQALSSTSGDPSPLTPTLCQDKNAVVVQLRGLVDVLLHLFMSQLDSATVSTSSGDDA